MVSSAPGITVYQLVLAGSAWQQRDVPHGIQHMCMSGGMAQ
jgi:hypothetical protein